MPFAPQMYAYDPKRTSCPLSGHPKWLVRLRGLDPRGRPCGGAISSRSSEVRRRGHSRQARSKTMPVIGFLRSTPAAPFAHLVDAFRRGLGEIGYVEGKNVAIALQIGCAFRAPR